MIKLIIWITRIIVAVAIALVFAACGGNPWGVKGSGKIVTQTRTVNAAFTGIDAGTGIEVRVSENPSTEITVTADDNLQELIEVVVEGNVLKVRSTGSYDAEETPVVTVQVPEIEVLKASSGATLKSTSTIKGTKLTCDSSSGSTLRVEAEADVIRLSSSSGSSLQVKGKALESFADASSGSSLNAAELSSNKVTASGSSGSTIRVAPLVELNADASSGSSIVYVKVPEKINTKTSSGGSVGAN
ncbi:head GIN domain-containing protein [Flavobacterium sp.]|uniref:head GIN domain-containing protein n=1 Tax=Flavobacterium sp. TaxID=239 RepID=UPI00262CFED0|nr:head GIN domain-containing protein [Flavobacterium sp.]